MKLTGSKRGGKHVRGNSGDNVSVAGIEKSTDKRSASGDKKNEKTGKKRTVPQRILRFAAIFLLVVAALTAAAMAYLKAIVKPPEVSDSVRNEPNASNQQGDGELDTPPDLDALHYASEGATNSPVERDKTKFTFVVLGTDDGNGLTDTIMVAMFDTTNYKFNVMNIPRDTLVYINGKGRRVNEMYGASKGETLDEKMRNYKASLADIIGFKVDFYVLVDLDAFRKLVDGIGGVDFYVPVNMNYEDPAQNLSIHISKGQQILNGTEALKVVRFRNTYSQGDIKRVEVQQDFLMEAAKQILAKRDSVPWRTLIDVFLTNVQTDLQLGNLMWFAQEFLKMDAENISLETIPADYFGNKNYVVINKIDTLLEFVNERLNPLKEQITKDNINIPTSAPSSGSSGSSGSNNSGSGNSNNSGSNNSGSNNSGSGGNTGKTETSTGGGNGDNADPVTQSPDGEPDATPDDGLTGTETPSGTQPETTPSDQPPSESPPDTEQSGVSDPPDDVPRPDQSDTFIVVPDE